MLDLKELSKKMTNDILKSLRKENDPIKPIIEIYIQKQLEELIKKSC